MIALRSSSCVPHAAVGIPNAASLAPARPITLHKQCQGNPPSAGRSSNNRPDPTRRRSEQRLGIEAGVSCILSPVATQPTLLPAGSDPALRPAGASRTGSSPARRRTMSESRASLHGAVVPGKAADTAPDGVAGRLHRSHARQVGGTSLRGGTRASTDGSGSGGNTCAASPTCSDAALKPGRTPSPALSGEARGVQHSRRQGFGGVVLPRLPVLPLTKRLSGDLFIGQPTMLAAAATRRRSVLVY